MTLENYLALDIGEKRIGVAVGSSIPFGRGIIDASDSSAVLDRIRDIVQSEEISKIIVGLPKVRSGEITQSQKIVYEWVDRLKSTIGLPVELVDESYSSQEAESQLRAMYVDTKQEKWRIDERAAELILAQYFHETPRN